MTLARGISLCILLSLGAAVPLWSQSANDTTTGGRRVTPPAGTWAAGADFGFSNPIGDDDFDAEPVLDGYIEYFTTNRVSWRGSLMFMEFDGPSIPGPYGVDIASVNGNVVYQWEGGTVHPFVTGGVGIYDYDADFGGDGTELGLNAGGGANFYLTDRFAIKLEGGFHGTTADRGPDSFFNGTVGARWLW